MSFTKSGKAENTNTNQTKYKKYDYKRRMSLITMVQQEKRTLASSAKELKICQTTARLIMKTWNQEKRVFEKKSDKLKREKKETKKIMQAQMKEKERLKREKKPKNLEKEVIEATEVNIKVEEICSDEPNQQICPLMLASPPSQSAISVIDPIFLQYWVYPTPFLVNPDQYPFFGWMDNLQ